MSLKYAEEVSGESSSALVELFAHVYTVFFGALLHLNVVKESSSNDRQGIIWPALHAKE